MLGFRRFCVMAQEGSQSFVDKGVVRPDAELLLDRPYRQAAIAAVISPRSTVWYNPIRMQLAGK